MTDVSNSRADGIVVFSTCEPDTAAELACRLVWQVTLAGSRQFRQFCELTGTDDSDLCKFDRVQVTAMRIVTGATACSSIQLLCE